VKMVEQWISKHKVLGSTSNFFWNFFSFIHTFIINSIHKVFPKVVEASLKNSLLHYSSVQSDSHGAVPSRDLNPCPCC
jgi:hypothetical protein